MLKLLSYNIRYGGVGREQALARTIQACAPDFVVLQEATRPAVVKRLAAETNMATWDSMPTHSVGFMSRLPVARHAWHRPPRCRRSYLEIELADSRLRIFGVHLTAIHSNWTERRRVLELQGMLHSIARHQDGFHVVAGDFNTLAPGEKLDWRRLPMHLRLLSLLGGRSIRWRTIDIMLRAGYVDGFRQLFPANEGHTFPTSNPHVRIDYVFVPGGEVDRLRRVEVVDGPLARAASDHFPLLAELEV